MVVIVLPDTLELAGALGVALRPPERPQPERDEDGARDEERPHQVQQLGEWCAPDEPAAHAVEDVGRRRQSRQDLHPVRQHVDGVVHAADQQQAGLQHERHLGAAFHVQERQDRGDHADPDEAERAEQHERERGHGVRVREVELREEQEQHDEDHGRVDEAVDHRVADRSQQLRPAPDGCHEGVLEGPFPALDRHGLGDPAEHDGEVVPEDRTHHQRQEQRRAVLVGTDERDRERARDGIDQEGKLPAPVAARQEEVSLDEGVGGLQLMGDDGHRSDLLRVS